jgi:serine phosphatase RsbU (regulator of sigma subunit)
LLRAAFQELPVPAFMLEGDGVVRRINRQAATLLGTPTGYAAGKPFAAFVDAARQAAIRTHVAAVAQTGEPRVVRARIAGTPPTEVMLTVTRLDVPGEASPVLLAVATAPPGRSRAKSSRNPSALPAPATPADADRALAAAAARFDVLSMASRQLLSDDSFSESVAIRRCARLLVERLGDWAIVEMQREGALRRQIVISPDRARDARLVHTLEAIESGPKTVPARVFGSGQSLLLPHTDDLEALGMTTDGTSAVGLLGARSLLSVPIRDDEQTQGVISLVRTNDARSYDLHDLQLVEELGVRLGLAIRSDRLFRRRASIADMLQASLLPRELPALHGVELASAYVTATRGPEVGGDFYEGFESPGGWSVVLGDVCGKGEEAAVVTAAARHAIRLLGHWNAEPDKVLRHVNQWLITQPESGRFVTAVLAAGVRVGRTFQLSVATAGHPPAIVVKADGVLRTGLGGGLPLGLFDDAEPDVEIFDLEPGDTLLLYSDGVLDATSPDGDDFGSERLADTLASFATAEIADMVSGVEAAVLAFSGGDLRDDVSMLAVRMLDVAEEPSPAAASAPTRSTPTILTKELLIELPPEPGPTAPSS